MCVAARNGYKHLHLHYLSVGTSNDSEKEYSTGHIIAIRRISKCHEITLMRTTKLLSDLKQLVNCWVGIRDNYPEFLWEYHQNPIVETVGSISEISRSKVKWHYLVVLSPIFKCLGTHVFVYCLQVLLVNDPVLPVEIWEWLSLTSLVLKNRHEANSTPPPPSKKL
jgi:hypothetical protein